jgi:phosphatidylglycerol:prolipoprotein diacylglycerol transferase
MFLSFLAAYWAFQEELKRKENQGLLSQIRFNQVIGEPASPWEMIGNGIFGFFLGFKIPYILSHWTAFSNEPPRYVFSWQGSWLFGILGFLIFGAWIFYEKWKQRLAEPKTLELKQWPHELMGNTALIAAISGILGAKLFDNLENWDRFIQDPIGNMFSPSGLTFYGGLIFGGIAVLWYMNKNGVKPLMMLDVGAPGMMLSYAVGRIGCQLSGDGDWGIINTHIKPSYLNWLPDWTWSFNFPHNVSNQDDFNVIPGCIGPHCNVLKHGVYPTSFYETLVCLVLFLILWSLRKKIHVSGILFCIYLIFNGAERFLIELIRVNTRYHLGSLSFTQAELISSLLFFSGIVGWILVSKNKAESPSV